MLLLHFLLARLIIGALNEDLVKDLEDQLEQCTNILKFTQSFFEGLPTFSDNRRRLTTDAKKDKEELEDDVEESLSTCMSLVQTINNFYKDLGDIDDGNDADSPWEDPIVLNVGGTQFSTTLATLRSENGTFFEKMFRNNSTTTCSADGTFFIDRNPETFEYILDYIRTGEMVVESADKNLRSQLLGDAEFFELSDALKEYLQFSPLAGIELLFSEVTWLNDALPKSIKLGGLLFDTSKDGDAASTFHDRCDGEGPTVTIVETTQGVVFGGYTDVSWVSGSGSWGIDKDAFVFRLRPAPIKKFEVYSTGYAIYRHSSYGPQFGNMAFRIANNCQDNADSRVGDNHFYGLIGNFLNDDYPTFRVKQYVVVQAV